MCDGGRLLTELKSTQCKKKELRCNPNGQCWCMRMNTKFTHPDDKEDCMSPQEMLAQGSVKITDSDRLYLESLKDREFIRNY